MALCSAVYLGVYLFINFLHPQKAHSSLVVWDWKPCWLEGEKSPGGCVFYEQADTSTNRLVNISPPYKQNKAAAFTQAGRPSLRSAVLYEHVVRKPDRAVGQHRLDGRFPQTQRQE